MTRSKVFCCAKNCYNYQQAPNAPTFFSFPKDIVSRAQWAGNAGRPDLITKSYASFLGRYFLCADHFEPECFVCPEKKNMFKRNINPIPTIFENNINNIVPIRNSRVIDDVTASGITTLATPISLDCPKNIVDENGSELSSIVTVELAPDNLLCSLDNEVNDVAITTVAPAEESIQMECLMLCRLCASLIEVSLLVPIFSDDAVPSINQMIDRFLPGKVLLEDGLPQHICSSCMERLRGCFESVELFQTADARLREMLQLCSLNGDAAKSNEIPEAVLSTFNLAPSSKPENPSLDEPTTMLTTVGLVPIGEKAAHVESEEDVANNVVTVLDVVNATSDFDHDEEDIVATSEDLDGSMTACNVCLKTLPSRSALFLHYFSTHTLVLKDLLQGNVSFQCTLCEETVENKKVLKQHLATHMPAQFVCIKCDKRFKSWTQLKTHVQTCDETSLVNEDLKLNTMKLEKKADRVIEKELKCSECGKEFRNRTSLKKHESIHSSDRNVLCSLCGKVLANLNSLRVHMRTHTDDRPYSCQECGKSFKGSTELRAHSVTHTREKVFECSECGRKFHTKSLVRQHMLSHTREKPHKCNFCPAAFNRLGNLNQHKKKHANARIASLDVTHECSICGKRFQSELTLKYHVAKHTGEKHPFDCGVCGKRFIAVDPYRVHMRIHTGERPYECSVCKKSFRSSATLKQHAGLHRDDFPYACPFCQRSFKRLQSLIVHKKTHTGEKPYPCPLCGRPFAQKGDMLKHTKTHRTQIEGESVIMEIDSIHDLTLSETDITNEFLMSMPIVKVEM